MTKPAEIIEFWFARHAKDWWAGAPEFDREIADRFAVTHARLALGEGFPWRTTPSGRLAEVIVLDQFSRQLYRGSAKAFAQDGMAVVLAQEAVAGGFDRALAEARRAFLYMPYLHSESQVLHEVALPLFAGLGDDFRASADQHAEVLRRFGRFPKRNAALGRTSTAEELAYLAEVGDRAF